MKQSYVSYGGCGVDYIYTMHLTGEGMYTGRGKEVFCIQINFTDRSRA